MKTTNLERTPNLLHGVLPSVLQWRVKKSHKIKLLKGEMRLADYIHKRGFKSCKKVKD